jgi:hypothetical protein
LTESNDENDELKIFAHTKNRYFSSSTKSCMNFHLNTHTH